MNTSYIYEVFYAESSGSICVPFRCVKPENYGSKSCDSQVTDARIPNLIERDAEVDNVRLYREIVGSLVYIITATRPDLCNIWPNQLLLT